MPRSEESARSSSHGHECTWMCLGSGPLRSGCAQLVVWKSMKSLPYSMWSYWPWWIFAPKLLSLKFLKDRSTPAFPRFQQEWNASSAFRAVVSSWRKMGSKPIGRSGQEFCERIQDRRTPMDDEERHCQKIWWTNGAGTDWRKGKGPHVEEDMCERPPRITRPGRHETLSLLGWVLRVRHWGCCGRTNAQTQPDWQSWQRQEQKQAVFERFERQEEAQDFVVVEQAKHFQKRIIAVRVQQRQQQHRFWEPVILGVFRPQAEEDQEGQEWQGQEEQAWKKNKGKKNGKRNRKSSSSPSKPSKPTAAEVKKAQAEEKKRQRQAEQEQKKEAKKQEREAKKEEEKRAKEEENQRKKEEKEQAAKAEKEKQKTRSSGKKALGQG